MTGRGYFVVARSIWDHPALVERQHLRKVVGEFSRREAWLWLLSEAAWKARPYNAGSIIVQLERGQLAHSTRYIAKVWKWPETNVRRFLERLKSGAMIGAATGAAITVITICNYDKYQLGEAESGAENGAENGAEPAQDRRSKEEGKKERTESPSKNPLNWPPDAFDLWWDRVPKKADKKDARQKLLKLQASGEISFEDLLAATDRWSAAMRGTQEQYIKAPSVWINKGGYLDESATVVRMDAVKSSPDPAKFTEDQWRSRIMGFAQNQRWVDAWGPTPNHPNCMAPTTILTQYGYDKEISA